MIGFFFYSTQYLQGVLGFSAFQAGVAFFPMTAVNFAVAMTIPRLTARLGQAVPLTAGVGLTLAGLAWLAQVQVTSSYWTFVAVPMVLIGAGQGLAFAPLTSAAAVLTARVDTALTAGTVLLAASLLAVLGLILPAHLRGRSPRPVAPQTRPGRMPEPAQAMTSA